MRIPRQPTNPLFNHLASIEDGTHHGLSSVGKVHHCFGSGRVFAEPDTFRLDRDPAASLLYGAGIHVCPGAPLARLELRLLMAELLGRTTAIEPIANRPPTLGAHPVAGYTCLPLMVR